MKKVLKNLTSYIIQVCFEKKLIPKPRVWVPDPSLVQLKLRILYIFQKNGRLYDMLMTFFFQMRIGYESSFLTRTNFTKKLRVFPLKKSWEPRLIGSNNI